MVPEAEESAEKVLAALQEAVWIEPPPDCLGDPAPRRRDGQGAHLVQLVVAVIRVHHPLRDGLHLLERKQPHTERRPLHAVPQQQLLEELEAALHRQPLAHRLEVVQLDDGEEGGQLLRRELRSLAVPAPNSCAAQTRSAPDEKGALLLRLGFLR